ncbi:MULTISPECIES: hypothetical protein [Pseudomonas]|uniref:Uncharacterized protein n=2 Tax=Pseudomonadaceae TaxID=135621 RepID=A0A0D0KL39_9PSED|nr:MULTISPECIES: hypothetical protein [Pseudomonas]KIP97675.1 hypothetical protein RU08_17405 [Pseudomonas fulva]MCW2294010.1 hypothetical protein [Pseudomonas sp. BIGb0408]NYH71420.1 hypothetical protein [Pseudomonas flavescens]
MAIHYSPSPDAVACGRTGSSLSATQDQAQVSCKLCLRSLEKEAAPAAAVNRTPTLAELRAAARAAKAPVKQPEPKAALSVREAWRQKLEQIPGRNRLPRGTARQAYV